MQTVLEIVAGKSLLQTPWTLNLHGMLTVTNVDLILRFWIYEKRLNGVTAHLRMTKLSTIFQELRDFLEDCRDGLP